MTYYLFTHENLFRILSFITMLVVMGIWESAAPRRLASVSRVLRWKNNLALVVFNTLAVKIIFPLSAAGLSLQLVKHDIGLINYWHLTGFWIIAISVVILDLAIYLQHRLFHIIPLFWRFHKVHHADLDYDVTTGLRFHTVEIILSMLIKFAVIFILGIPAVAVIIFEIILNAMSMFNHSNIKLPLKLDAVLRCFLVTPDMHRIHHSVISNETNSNFGFNLPLWDRIFFTYIAQPRLGHTNMTIGLSRYRDIIQVQTIWGILILPFRQQRLL